MIASGIFDGQLFFDLRDRDPMEHAAFAARTLLPTPDVGSLWMNSRAEGVKRSEPRTGRFS